MEESLRLEKNKKISLSKQETLNRHSQMICKSFTVKIQKNSLNEKQKEALNRIFLEAKWYKNYILNWLENPNNKLNEFPEKIKEITHKDKDNQDITVTIKYLSHQQRQSLKSRLSSNIKTLSSLKKRNKQHPGKLKFSKEEKNIDLKQYGMTHKILSSKSMKIQGIPNHVRVNGLEQFIFNKEAEICNGRLLHLAGDYYVQLVVYFPKEQIIKNNEILGIDFGCSTSFTLSTGEKIDIKIPESERVKKLERKLSKKKKGSKNFYKTKTKLQKAYLKISNQKNDTSNKLLHKLYSYQTIVIQDEQLQNWHKTGHGKAIQYSILGRVKSKLKEMDNVIVLSKWEPTSQYCPKCQSLTKHALNQRTFHCSLCGYEDDRDINAAKNMVRFYLRNKENSSGTERINACGDESSNFLNLNLKSQLSSMKQEGTTL